jgi:hypothetical protein
VARERVQQVDVALRVVHRFPVVLLDVDDLEEAAGLDLVAVVVQLLRPRHCGVGREGLADLVIDLLQLVEERVAVVGDHVARPPQREVAARLQGVGRPAVAHSGVDPVPRGRGEDQRERFAHRGPVLEACLDHLDVLAHQVRPRGRREGSARLDAGDAEPALRERTGRLAGGAADLQQARACRQTGDPEKVVVKLARIVRPSSLIQLRRSIERRRQTLAFVVRGHRPSLPHNAETVSPGLEPETSPRCPQRDVTAPV